MNKTKTLFAFGLLSVALTLVSPQTNAWPFRHNKCCDPCDPCCNSGKVQTSSTYTKENATPEPDYTKKEETSPDYSSSSATPQTTSSKEADIKASTSSEPKELIVPQDQGIESITSSEETMTTKIESNTNSTSSTNYYPGLW